MATYVEYKIPKIGRYFYNSRYSTFEMQVEVLGECAKTYRIKTLEIGEGGVLPYIGTILYVKKRDIKIVKENGNLLQHSTDAVYNRRETSFGQAQGKS